MTTHVKRGYIRELAKKEGVDESRSWEQFWEALPHVRRLYEKCGDVRAAWGQYLDAFCRMRRPSTAWKPSCDCFYEALATGAPIGEQPPQNSYELWGLVEAANQ